MKRIIFALTQILIVIAARVDAQTAPIFVKGELSATNNHTGKIWLNELSMPDSTFNYSVAQAVYDKSAKLDWHIHPAGQILMVTEGEGYYQEKGQPAKVIHKGDVVKCPPGVAHWHGSTPGSTFTYVAVTPAQKGKTIWLQRVTDDEYKNAKNK
ncbi:cupin domain-containing protein [Mucilaginibacter ginkgonis]|uniref:Cupin domain-containing protein n=1 Tax=Mucilaginibacter ginkgonis TaxID=2682091 RepID=A0A6I4HVH3_9SPHI|nr:cupin domain-containing protein [Mucilaginibacter ginkgonis]QQL49839.1 cupin domain-containing protein [Mucilaginibacter ginkgonis]